MTEEHRQRIADPATPEAALIGALARLGPVTEPPDFWAALADSDRYSERQRRHFVGQLFHRHVRPGMRLSTLAAQLGDPRWLAPGDIAVIEDLGGALPVQMLDRDTVFRLQLFPESALPNLWAIYLRVSGRLTADQLYALLRGHAGGEAAAAAAIREIGFSPPPVQSVPRPQDG